MRNHFHEFAIWLSFLLSAVRVAIGASADSSAFELKMTQLVDGGDKDFSWITPALRPKVIARLKAMQATGDRNVMVAVARTLLEVSDDETIQAYAIKFRNGDYFAGSMLSEYGREKAIQYIAPDISTGSFKQVMGEDSGFMPERVQAALNVAWIVARSPAFPEQTRRWAKHNAQYSFQKIAIPPDDSTIEMMRQWWEQNKREILEGRYAEATWLPEERQSNAESPPQMPTPFARPSQSALMRWADSREWDSGTFDAGLNDVATTLTQRAVNRLGANYAMG